MNLDVLMQSTTSISGLVCSVYRVYNIKYLDFLEVFGSPHEINKENILAKWIYKMYNGTKVEFRYDRDDYTLYKLGKLKARSMPRVPFEEINFVEIMMDPADATTIIAFLLSVFKTSHYEKTISKHKVIRQILNGAE